MVAPFDNFSCVEKGISLALASLTTSLNLGSSALYTK